MKIPGLALKTFSYSLVEAIHPDPLNLSAEPPKPKFPKKYIQFVDEEAMDWLTNLVDID